MSCTLALPFSCQRVRQSSGRNCPLLTCPPVVVVVAATVAVAATAAAAELVGRETRGGLVVLVEFAEGRSLGMGHGSQTDTPVVGKTTAKAMPQREARLGLPQS